MVQRKSINAEVGSDVESGINALKGGGQPLPVSVRTFFEPRFGYDFSNVRVHTDLEAADTAKKIHAKAFTIGSDVVFGTGQYAPETIEGSRVLSHELTHVIQQDKSSIENLIMQPFLIQRNEEDEGTSGSTGATSLTGLAMHRYRGCQGEQDFYVDLAQSRAPRWIYSAIHGLEVLLQPHEIISAAESTLNRFFHPPEGGRRTIGGRHRPETVQLIIARLNRMARAIENPRLIRCVSRATCGRENADYDPNASAYAGQGTVISICPNFFNRDINDQVITLIHESAHHIGLMRNVTPREQVMSLPLNRALNNAESYALLVYENFVGPPVPPGAPPPERLTDVWSPAYMSSEVMFNEPVNELFYEGGGRRRLLSSVQETFEAPFPSTQPIRFSGQVRFYVDAADTPLPQGTTLPVVSTQVYFTESGTGSSTELYDHYGVNPNEYLGPGLPLRIPFSPDFDFTLRSNGRVRFTFWMSDPGSPAAFYAFYDDTITVLPENEI